MAHTWSVEDSEMSDSNAMPFIYFQVGPLAKNTSVGCLGSIFEDIIFS